MKHMIPTNEEGLFATHSGKIMMESWGVAEGLGKEHKILLRDIRRMLEKETMEDPDYYRYNFVPVEYTDKKGQQRPAYAMTREGVAYLITGYSGEKARTFRRSYTTAFGAMESQLIELQTAKADYPRLTDAIKKNKPDAKPYHYRNEADMLNCIVLGMNAKQYRSAHNLPNGSIRPFLAADKLRMLDRLELFDADLYYIEPDYHVRKAKLTELYQKLRAEDDRAKLAQIAQITAGTEAV